MNEIELVISIYPQTSQGGIGGGGVVERTYMKTSKISLLSIKSVQQKRQYF